MGGIGDVGWPCSAGMGWCGIGGFVRMDRGIDCPCDCEDGDVDLLVPSMAWGVLGEEPWEFCCDVCRGRFGVGALGIAGVTCGEGVPVDDVCLSSWGGSATASGCGAFFAPAMAL